MKTFRHTARQIVPRWLRRGNAGRIGYAWGFHLDGLTDAVVAAIKYRFPGLYGFESLPYIGRDRRIRRGRNESDATYAARLPGWLDAHARKGSPYTLLEQLHAHFAPNNFRIELLYSSGLMFEMTAAGEISRTRVTWTAPYPGKYAHWWLFYHSADLAVPDGDWDDPGTWDDGGVWDSGLPAVDVADLGNIARDWNNGRSFGHIVFLDDGQEWDDFDPGEWPTKMNV